MTRYYVITQMDNGPRVEPVVVVERISANKIKVAERRGNHMRACMCYDKPGIHYHPFFVSKVFRTRKEAEAAK